MSEVILGYFRETTVPRFMIRFLSILKLRASFIFVIIEK